MESEDDEKLTELDFSVEDSLATLKEVNEI